MTLYSRQCVERATYGAHLIRVLDQTYSLIKPGGVFLNFRAL